MSISYQADGSVVMRSDVDPTRAQTIAAGTPEDEQDVLIVAFFATDAAREAEPSAAAEPPSTP